MANKAFEIQNSTLKIGGVELQAGNTGVVIPGVTRATSYKVEEVNDTGDQTYQFAPDTEGVVVVIDVALYNTIIAQGNENGFADYTVVTDDEGFIDEIKVNGQGSYTQLQARDAETADMYAYVGSGSASDRPLVTQDWIQVPFRPKIRAGEVETISSGSGGGVTLREINFPYGEEGDTAGTIALTQSGDTFICTDDFVATGVQTFTAINDSPGGGSAQGMTGCGFTNANEDFYNFLQAGYNGTLEFSQDGGDTWGAQTGVGDHTDQDPPYYSFSWYSNTLVQEGDEVEIRFTPNTVAIWKYVNTGTINQLVETENGNTFALMTEGDVVFDGEGPGGVDRGLVWQYGDNQNGINSMVRQDQSGLTVRAWTENNIEGNYSAPVNIVTNQDADQKTWSFDGAGAFTFPDGSVQTTAYTGPGGGTTTGPLYIVGNSDGNITYSTDGTTWSESFDTGLGAVGTVAIGPEKIIYTRSDVNGDGQATGMYATNSPTAVPTLISGTDIDNGFNLYWEQVQYFEGTTYPWVAVGSKTTSTFGDTTSYPIIGYSTNGVTWSFTNITVTGAPWDSNGWHFTDIAYGNGYYVISGSMFNNGSGDLWYTQDLTADITLANQIPLDASFKAVEFFNSPGYGVSWTAFTEYSDNFAIWSSFNSNPTVSNDWTTFIGTSISDLIFNETGLSGRSVEEAAAGLSDGGWMWMTSSGDGQIVWWPNAPAGPFVSLPNPYTSNINDIVRNQSGDGLPTTIVVGNGYYGYNNGEKITISGVTSHTENGSTTEQSYNGVYYVKTTGTQNIYELYLDQGLSQPWDTSTYWPVDLNTGTVTWSHGTYLDALGYAAGHFYVGNDDEEIFKSEFNNGNLTWTKVDDKSNSLRYWNDFAYYATFSTSASTSVTIAEAAPSGSNGALWFNSQEGRMYIKYSGAWIDASPTEVNSNQVLTTAGGSVILSGEGDTEVFSFPTLLDIIADNENPNALTIRNALVPNYGLELYVQDDGVASIARGNGVDGDSAWLSVGTTGTTTISNGATKQWEFNTDGKFKLPAGGDIVDSNGVSVLSSGSSSSISNTDGQPQPSTYSVSVATTGVITMTTSRGGIEFGALPEVGGASHLHIMRPAGQESSTDLFFGDDYNYVKLVSNYGGQLGVEIGTNSAFDGNGTQRSWRFGTDGILTIPEVIQSQYNSNCFLDLMDNNVNSVLASATDTYIKSNYNSGDKVWKFASTGELTLSDAGKIVAYAQDANIVVETHDSSSTYDWTFGGNGITTVPGRIQGKTYEILSNVIENIDTATGAGANNQYIWIPGNSQFQTLYNLGAAAIGMKIWGVGGENNKATIIAAPDQALSASTLHLDGPIYGGYPLTAATVTPTADPIILGNTSRWSFNPDGTLTLPSSTVNTAFNTEVYFTNDHYQTVFETYDTSHNGGDGDKGKGPAVILDLDSGAVNIRPWGLYKTWSFNNNGNLYSPTNGVVNVKGSPPTHSYGEPGDVQGMTAFDSDYFYYCKSGYVNNSTNIWVRVAWSGTTW